MLKIIDDDDDDDDDDDEVHRVVVILSDVLGSILERVVCRCRLHGTNVGPFSLLDYIFH